ncbi:hypothetical protein C0Z18_31440 [Trinickia dabaoshanensis]|uniref:Amine oxidase domain-containing protein n=1 Tax=Trinickia dabaoshanensis TaxID=564714 RepID=A0A2N7VBE2_9BURK|nr:hypothetical protein C0Z18_31440 [Trinickia dabaoshanensis]
MFSLSIQHARCPINDAKAAQSESVHIAQGGSSGVPCMHSVVARAGAEYRARLRTSQTVTGLTNVNGRWVLTTHESGECPDVFDAIVLANPALQANALLRDVSPALSVVTDRAIM